MYSQTALPPAWRWPKFQNIREIGGPAFLTVEKNHTYGYSPKFDERPEGHKILLVSVTASQRRRCLRELMAALGQGAVRLGGDAG